MSMDYEIARGRMIQEQLIAKGIRDERVLRTMGAVPRHYFVDQAFWPRAYGDHPLPIGHDQTISQPYIVALMTQELSPSEGDRILEIGTGSGYQAAVLSLLGCEVYTVERHPELTERAKKILKRLDIRNVHFRVGDGSIGWKEKAPFDGIVVTAGAPDIPDELLEQLDIGGRIIIPVGTLQSQRLVKVVRRKKIIERHEMIGCSFVPLVGDRAWSNG
jgi:protein-L-isoaspartate(D-aspartate) O-methyltransferase